MAFAVNRYSTFIEAAMKKKMISEREVESSD